LFWVYCLTCWFICNKFSLIEEYCIEELWISKILDTLNKIAIKLTLIEALEEEFSRFQGVGFGGIPPKFVVKLGLVPRGPVDELLITEQSIEEPVRLIHNGRWR